MELDVHLPLALSMFNHNTGAQPTRQLVQAQDKKTIEQHCSTKALQPCRLDNRELAPAEFLAHHQGKPRAGGNADEMYRDKEPNAAEVKLFCSWLEQSKALTCAKLWGRRGLNRHCFEVQCQG
eukprot:1141821-Pelagomonas_calceolata.AAC.3